MTNRIAPLGTNVSVQPASTPSSSLDQTAFLRLMTTQLQEQDPFNPMDNSQMVAQMAQFSSVAGISEMNGSLKSIAEQISAQTDLLTQIQSATAANAAPRPAPGV
jgi:flagellar basal-body rod modification protein FlgD